jgi:hypothetical protein
MPHWKTRTLMVVLVLMLAGGACQAQETTDGMPQAAAPQALRGGSPSPYVPPVSVPSVAGQIQPLQLPAPTITVTPTPAPTFSSGCDSAGCWGSDGTRYNAVGPTLVRPDGRNCQIVAGAVSCP